MQLPQTAAGSSRARGSRPRHRLEPLVCGGRPLRRRGTRARGRRARGAGADRLRERRLRIPSSRVAAAAGLGAAGPGCGGGRDPQGVAVRGGASPAADLARLRDIVELFPQQTILVLGDSSRVSREAPVLILRHRETQCLPGGGANAANNLADLGAHVQPVGAIGDDESGSKLHEYFRGKGVDVAGLIRVRGWTTPTKTRFLAGWTHTARQQVLRMDREPEMELPPQAVRALVRAARGRLAEASAMGISD